MAYSKEQIKAEIARRKASGAWDFPDKQSQEKEVSNESNYNQFTKDQIKSEIARRKAAGTWSISEPEQPKEIEKEPSKPDGKIAHNFDFDFGYEKEVGDPLRHESTPEDVERGKHLTKLVLQTPARAALGITDIPHGLYNLGTMATNFTGLTDNAKGFEEKDLPSTKIKEALGVELEKPQGTIENIGSAILEGAAGGPMGGIIGNLGKGVKYIEGPSKFLLGQAGNAQEAASLAKWGAGVSGAIQTLQEAGIDTSPLALAGMSIPLAASGKNLATSAISKIKSGLPGNVGERMAVKDLIQEIGTNNLENVVKNIDAGLSQDSNIGYRPTTAQIANSPGLSKLEDTYVGTPRHKELSEDLSQRFIEQQGAINDSIEKLKPESSVGPQASKDFVTSKEESRHAMANADELKQQTEAKKAVDTSLERFKEKATKEEAGEAIRKKVEAEHERLIEKRKFETKDLEKKIYDSNDYVYPSHTNKALKHELEVNAFNNLAEGPLLKVKNSIVRMIDQAEKRPESYKKALDIIKDKAPDSYKEIMDAIKSQADTLDIQKIIQKSLKANAPELMDGFIKSLKPRVRELYNLRKTTSNLMSEASSPTAKAMYGKMLKAIDLDLSKFPYAKEYRQKYREHSIPITNLEKSRAFLAITKQDKFKQGYVTPSSELPKKYFKGIKSKEDAIQLNKVIGEEERNVISKHINEDIINNILDPKTGLPSQSKIDSWKKGNPGAFVFNKNLDAKLRSVNNATQFLKNLEKSNYRSVTDEYKSMVKIVTGSNPEHIVSKMFGSKDSLKRIDDFIKILKEDQTGQAFEGARRSVVELVEQNAKSPYKFMNFYKKNKKNIEKFFDSEQMKVLDEINVRFSQKYENRRNPGVHNSATTPRKTMLQKMGGAGSLIDSVLGPVTGAIFGSTIIPGSPFKSAVAGASLGAISKYYKGSVESVRQKIIHQTLLDPEFAKSILQKNTNESKEAFRKALYENQKRQFSGYPIGKYASETKEEE